MREQASVSDRWPEPDPGPNRTGGAVWHARAFAAQSRWRPTRHSIAHWLGSAGFEASELVVVGASAGWMMPTAFFARFERVTAVDIDPLARPLFALRHGWRLRASGVRVAWRSWDALALLDQTLERSPRAAILFDNVLGQQIYRSRQLDALEQALGGLARRLEGREWASLHDWLSGPATPAQPGAIFSAPTRRVRVGVQGVLQGTQPLSWEALAESCLAVLGGHGEWQDHRTAGIFPVGTEVSLIPWEFRRGKWHWLQAGRVAGAR